MLSAKIRQTTKTLAFRLTLYYAGLFSLSMLVVCFVIYLSTAAVLRGNQDEDLLSDIDDYSTLLAEGRFFLLDELEKEVVKEDNDTFFFRLISLQGEEILFSDLDTWPGLETPGDVVARIAARNEPFLETKDFPGQEDATRIVYAKLAPGYYLQLAESTTENEEILQIIVTVFTRALLPILLFGGLTGWYMARRALGGVEEVTKTAGRISSGDFSHRVPLKSRGLEIEQLATTFNFMLDRIQSLINGIRDVTEALAHDLRSPITSIRGTAETTLINSADIDDYKNMAGNTIDECDRLLGLINSVLDIAEAESGAEKLLFEEIELTEVVRQACELFLPIAEEREISLTLQASMACAVRGDTKKIQRLIANLIDNALKYTLPGGAVSVTISCAEKNVEVRVDDNGIGIAADEIPHIFQRFYRCDQSRSQTGTGLGLSLAHAVASAHGGSIEVVSELHKGSSFRLAIPKAASLTPREHNHQNHHKRINPF